MLNLYCNDKSKNFFSLMLSKHFSKQRVDSEPYFFFIKI